jgi:hypothetical protein
MLGDEDVDPHEIYHKLIRLSPLPFRQASSIAIQHAFAESPYASYGNSLGKKGKSYNTNHLLNGVYSQDAARRAETLRSAAERMQAPEGPTMAPEGLGVPEATQTPPERQTPQEGTEELPKTPFPTKHPMVQNPDGSYSNIVTTTVGIGDRHYVIPTMVEGKQLSVREAVDVAKSYGLDKYPSFDNAKDAEQASIDIHNAQVTPSEKQQGSLPQTDWLNTHGGKGGSDLADVLDENGYL